MLPTSITSRLAAVLGATAVVLLTTGFSPEPAPDAPLPQDVTAYTIQPGDSLESLALEFDVSVSDLAELNQLRPDRQLRPGARLLVPGSQPLVELALLGGGTIRFRPTGNDRFYPGYCTWYVAQRRAVPWLGDAGQWPAAATAMGFRIGSGPRPGAIMVSLESGPGHVAFVEKVNPDGSWVVSEMNYLAFDRVNLRTLRPGQVAVAGFIYEPGGIAGISGSW